MELRDLDIVDVANLIKRKADRINSYAHIFENHSEPIDRSQVNDVYDSMDALVSLLCDMQEMIATRRTDLDIAQIRRDCSGDSLREMRGNHNDPCEVEENPYTNIMPPPTSNPYRSNLYYTYTSNDTDAIRFNSSYCSENYTPDYSSYESPNDG